MSEKETVIHLSSAMFGERERVLAQRGQLVASTFLFETGVAGLRLRNDLGELVLLPYQGQQIWAAKLRGRDMTMISMFPEPRPTREYLGTYGGFLLHCGATAMGGPSAQDTHPLHGELPNAPYQKAFVVLGNDEQGEYIGLGGLYQHTVAFTCNYTAEPLVKLYAGSAILDASLVLTNLKKTAMEWMYLAHINFRPIDGARLVYSAPCDPKHCRVRKNIPAHVATPPGFREFLGELEQDPGKHNRFSTAQPYDPEVCFYLDYTADREGWSHSMQVLPDGQADYVAHRPEQLDKAVRWIAANKDQYAMGVILPATAEPEGFKAEKEKGNVRLLQPGASARMDLRIGALTSAEAAQRERAIAELLKR